MKHSPSRGRWLRRLWLTLILTLPASSALAQLSTAALNGVVTDPTGAVIPKASLVLRNVDTGIETQAISNDTGNYRFSNVSPGRYT